MENASKALLIAASVLIGIIIISMAVMISTVFRTYVKEYSQKEEQKKIEAFNAQFSKYEHRDLNAQDVLTIVNTAKEWKEQSGETLSISGINSFGYDELRDDINNYTKEEGMQKYKMIITGYNEEGRISNISISKI